MLCLSWLFDYSGTLYVYTAQLPHTFLILRVSTVTGTNGLVTLPPPAVRKACKHRITSQTREKHHVICDRNSFRGKFPSCSVYGVEYSNHTKSQTHDLRVGIWIKSKTLEDVYKWSAVTSFIRRVITGATPHTSKHQSLGSSDKCSFQLCSISDKLI